MEKTTLIDTSFLKNEKVIVQFIPKPTKEIRDPNHIAYGGKMQDTYDYIVPPRLRKERMNNILTDKEKAGLEYLMKGTNLSVYGDFWKGFKKGGLFPIALGKDDKFLDLSVPEDYIVYKVLLNTDIIANSPDEIKNKPKASYKYVIVKENEGAELEKDRVNNKAEAYAFFSKINKDSGAMRYVLSQLGKHTHKGQDDSFLIKEVGKAIETPKEMETILRIAEDKFFDIKILIENAFTLGVIERVSGQYFTKENEPIAGDGDEPTLENAAKFLSSPVGQEMRFAIEARVKNAKE